MGRDDDLARAEGPDRIVDGDERVAITDLAMRLDPDRRQTSERDVEPLLSSLAGWILVGGVRLQARVQRGADDVELRPLGQRERADRAEELLALDRLVRNDEDAPLVRAPEHFDVLALRRGAALA